MEISIIIVSFNVKHFLEQCLCSLQNALVSLEAEIIVVDNFSGDGTAEFIQKKHPTVKLIANNSNEGFGKANNKALLRAAGKYILFLNPDTILSENSIRDSIGFLKSRPEAGALGIRMIDGSGKYLPESKRGFPTPWASFCKMSGLTKLFPRSSVFARYYLGHLSNQTSHEVEALSGAFMLIRKEAIDKAGGFDEQFFMYAEDIDLSYRIIKAGYKNYYFAGATIIHFKGESTLKDSTYINNFYGAMNQFVTKHYKNRFPVGARILNVAIQIRAGIARVLGSHTKSTRAKNKIYNNFQLIGDAEVVREGSIFKNHVQEADSIIFCIGKSFSYTAAISEMERNAEKKSFFIHGPKTRTAVGSDNSNRQGQVLGPFDPAIPNNHS